MSVVRAAGLIRRALSRSPGELTVRLGQQAHIAAERFALAAGRHGEGRLSGWLGPSGTGPLEHFRSRSAPRFFAGLDSRDAALPLLRTRWPDAERATVQAADRILAGHFDLLGYRGLPFGSPPDWHLDPVRGTRAPSSPHWSRIPYLDPAVAGDHKVVWEVNRQQYLLTLGQAYWYTGDERYATAFVAHLTSWMDANPPRQGVNWASSLEVAFRAISWLWALHFFRTSPALTEPFFARVVRVLALHARHIEKYLSTYFSPNTHLTGEALGLFYLGTLLPELPGAARWQTRGLAILAAELPRQVRADGVYFEQSTWYHRYTTDFLIHLVALCRVNGIAAGAQHEPLLGAMLDHLAAVTRPDGTVPLIGDDDGGCLLPVDGPPTHDFRATLATGAALLGREDCRYVAGDAARETFWLLGAEGLRRFDALARRPPRWGSRAFRQSGFYVMRDGWHEDAGLVVVDAGPHGSLAGGHAHADALAVVASVGPHNLLIDSGTGTYTTDPNERDRFRSTAAHNTVTIDGESSSLPGGAFRWQSSATTTVERWISTDRFDFFRGVHDGFTRIAPGLLHEREILFVKGDYWILRDRVAGAGARRVLGSLHFGADTAVTCDGAHDVIAAARPSGARTRIHVHGATIESLTDAASVSDVYGSFHDAPRCVVRADGGADADVLTLVLPHSAAHAAIRAVDSDSGTVLTLEHGDVVDWIIVGTAATADTRVVSDCSWAWVRCSARSGAVLDYIVVDGATLRIDDVDILSGRSSARPLWMKLEEPVEDSLAQD